MPGGRPTKYKPEYCKAIVDFFSVEPNRKEITAEIKGYGKAGNQNFEKQEYKLVANPLPTLAKFARKIGVNKDTIIEWTKVHSEFSDAYNVAKDLQKDFLVDNGLAGLYPPASFIFTAKNITDMRDKQEVDNNVFLTGFEKLNDDQLDATLAKLKNQLGESPSGESQADSREPS
jgi:hypothetical protein